MIVVLLQSVYYLYLTIMICTLAKSCPSTLSNNLKEYLEQIQDSQ